MMNYIKYILLICLLFLISGTLRADDPSERSLPTSESSTQTQEMTESTRTCFTYLLHQEERIDINVDNIEGGYAGGQIKKLARAFTKDGVRSFRKEIRDKLNYMECFMSRERLREITFPDMPPKEFDKFFEDDDGNSCTIH